MSMEEVAHGMDEGRASLQFIMEQSAEIAQSLRDAPADIQALEEHLRSALAIAEHLAPLLGYSVLQPLCDELETAADGYSVLEGSTEHVTFQAGIETIEGHLEVPRRAVGLKRTGADIANVLRKLKDMPASITAAKEGYDHAAGAAEVLLKIDTAYRADKGLPAGK